MSIEIWVDGRSESQRCILSKFFEIISNLLSKRKIYIPRDMSTLDWVLFSVLDPGLNLRFSGTTRVMIRM